MLRLIQDTNYNKNASKFSEKKDINLLHWENLFIDQCFL